MCPDRMKIGFVVKRYPRYSETFIVREILAHEDAGAEIEIFALRPTNDRYFQDAISKVRAPVNYLYMPPLPGFTEPMPVDCLPASVFWDAMQEASHVFPDFWKHIETAVGVETRTVYQAILLAHEVCSRGIQHLHAPFSNMPATVARLAARFAGITFSFTARAKDIFHESVDHTELNRKLIEASAVVTITEYNLEYLRATYGAAAEKVQHVYNGLDLAAYPFAAPENRPPRILAVGRLVEKKGFSDLIDACALLRQRGLEFDCKIIGAGTLKETLQTQIARLGLEAYVELGGARPHYQVIREMQEAAVFTLPCIVGEDGDRDGLPNVLFEAMALGTPCVSTDVTGIPEILHHGETGLMVAQRNPQELACALERLLLDVPQRVRLATSARALIEQRFDAHRNAARRRALFYGVDIEADEEAV